MLDLCVEYTDALNNAKSKQELEIVKEAFEEKQRVIENKFKELEKSGDYSLEDVRGLLNDKEVESKIKGYIEAEKNAEMRLIY